MAYKRIPTLCIEDAEIFWKNFSGREQQYNEKGDAKAIATSVFSSMMKKRHRN